MKSMKLRINIFIFVVICFWVIPSVSLAIPDKRFDVVTFCCPCSVDDHMCQTQFDYLNWHGSHGHYIAMGTDAHRMELDNTGNVLAIYINDITTGFTTTSGSQAATNIHQDNLSNFTTTGTLPTWILLNEISASQWPSNSTYRIYIRDLVSSLNTTYGYQPILFSPFPNPGANGSDWQAVSQYSYIAIEQYLSGEEIAASGYSVSWCQSQYQNSKNSYTTLGVPSNRLFLAEHFGQTTSGTAWGRSGLSVSSWDTAIMVRSQAARNVGFEGYATYAWAKNAMLASDTDLLHFEDTYRREPFPLSTSDYYYPTSVKYWESFK